MKTRNRCMLLTVVSILQAVVASTDNTVVNSVHRHVQLCVRAIMNQHFTSERPLLLSFPHTQQDGENHRLLSDTRPADLTLLMDEMLQTINRDSKWKLCISRPGADMVKPEFNTHYNWEANIIFTWPEEGKDDVMPNLIQQVKDIFLGPVWNSRVRFLIISIHGSDSPEVLAHTVFENLWTQYQITDILLLVPDCKLLVTDDDSCSLNDPKFVTTSLCLFTWFPFSIDRGLVLIDVWVVEGEGRFLKETDLFPSKIPNNFHGHHINACVFPFPQLISYHGNYTDDENLTNHNFTECEISFVQLLTSTLNLRVHYQYLAPNPEFLTDFVSEKCNFTLGGMPLDAWLLDYWDFVFPYAMMLVKVYVPCPKPFSRIQKISEIFDLSSWLCICLVFVLVTVAFLYLAKPPCNEYRNECQHYGTLSMCCYNVWAVTLGFCVTGMPRSVKMRVAFMLFVWYCFAMSTVFQIFFTSVLVDPGLQKQISSLDEVLSSGLEYGYDPYHDNYFFEDDSSDWRHAIIRANRKSCLDYEKCLRRTVENGDFVTMLHEPMKENFVAVNYPYRRNVICAMDGYIRFTAFTLYFQKGSPFVEPFNSVIHRALEGGFGSKIVSDMRSYWSFRGVRSSNNSEIGDNSDSVYFVFSMAHLEIAFVILIMGLSLSCSVLVLEMLHSKFG